MTSRARPSPLGSPSGGAPAGFVSAPFAVAIDTREQAPYSFDPADLPLVDDAGPRATGKPLFIPVVRQTLRLGDYGIGGMLGCRIERKSKEDLYASMSTLPRRRNWEQRLEQMCEQLDFAAVVVESTYEDAMSSPPPHTRFAPKSMSRTVLAWMVRYPKVHWAWRAGRQMAAATTYRILERYYLDHLDIHMPITDGRATQAKGGKS